MPTVLAFRDGQPASSFVGVLREPEVLKFLASLEKA